MQKRKSFFNNEMEQRFSLRKYTIGLCSVCLGFVVIGMGSQTVKADTVNGVEKSSAVQENKAQDTDSANTDALAESKTNTSDSVVAKSNTTPTETKENEAGSVAATAPKTADSNNSASVNTLDQSKSENSSAVAPTSEKTQLQTSQDSSIKVKENNLNTNKSDTPKTVVQPTSLNDENNLRDPDSKDVEVKPKESSNVDTNEQKETSTALPKQPANADTQLAATTSGVQPFVNLAVESDNNDLTPKHETIDSQWTIHYVNQADHKQELKDPTVITMQYTRTNTPQSDGKIQYGDWSYVPDSFKQTGTPITVKDSNNPVKQDNVDKNGENMDVFTITAMYPTVAGYGFYNGINGTRLHDDLVNDNRQADTMSKDFYAEYDVAKERSVAVKFVDDQSFDPNVSGGKAQVGQAITVTGRDGDTVNLNLTVPDKYQLADGQQLPTTYTFAKGSGDLKIHLVHKVVQREATIDVPLLLTTLVRTRGDDSDDAVQGVVTQTRWKQLEDSHGNLEHSNISFISFYVLPFVEVGTLTGHVDYDLVDKTVVSLKNDWTSLNLSGHSYELPNGTEVVNGIRIDANDTIGKKLRDDWYLNEYRKWHSDVDPDYITRPWYGYLSVNETNNEINSDYSIMSDVLGLQAGLVGDEPNALAKAIGDRAATSVEMANKTIDPNWLKGNGYIFDFSEQDGQLRAKAPLLVAGVYIPYVEKTATRTIKVTTPDGKTITVKQTATLAKQVDFADDAHPAWTTGEWANYDVPTIPGYTASQSQIAKTAVTGTTEDQTVNITYTANPQTATVVYQSEDGISVHTTTVNGHTGQTVKVSNEVPVGWHVVNGTVPSEITFGPNGTPKTVVTIAHSHATVTPDAPKTTSDKLPDNPAKTYPAGVSHDDLNKTITGTIKVTMPDGQIKTVVKAAHLTRTADVDEVTGEVTYSDWTTGYWSDYTAPSVPGYTANYPYIAGQLVTSDTNDQTINITYTANDGTQTIVYQDEDGSEVGKQVVPGKTDETVKVTPDVPDGYVLKGEIPTEVTIKPDDTPITVTVEHGKSHVTPDKPVNKGDLIPDTKDKHYPEGLTHNDLNKTVTREITITDPTGKKTTTTQTVTFTRGATVDEVTNEVTYDDWSENGKHTFDKVDVPNVPGYTASGEVPSIAVTPETQSSKVDITYTANTQTATITYIDDTTKTNLDSKEANGKFGQAITFGTAPTDEITNYEKQGYKLVSNNFKPGIKYQNDNKFNIFEVHLVHTYEPVETSQTITETIHYIDVNGKPVAPDYVAKAVIEMTGTRDKVTNSITWNTPSTGHFDEVISPEVPNMTPDKKFIPSRNVQYGDSDITENVVYTSDETSREPEKPNDQGKPNSKTPEKPNKSGNPTSKTSEKSNKSSKEVSKQFGTIAKTTIPEKPIDSRTVDNHVSAKTTTKRELPQTGTTANTGIWTGLVSIITSLGLLGASKKRKKN